MSTKQLANLGSRRRGIQSVKARWAGFDASLGELAECMKGDRTFDDTLSRDFIEVEGVPRSL